MPTEIKNIKVSICLLAWNGKKYLDACLKSVLSQTHQNFDLLIIDNASTDSSVEYLENNYSQIRLIKNSANIGFDAGHNQGIRKTEGKYHLMLNQDTVLEPNYIEELIKASERNPHIGAVQGKVKRLTEGAKTNIIDSLGLKLWRSGQATDLAQGEYDREQYQADKDIFGVVATLPLYRREALEDTKLSGDFAMSGEEYFDETFFVLKEDIDLAFRLQLRKWRAVYVPSAVAYHERGVSGGSANSQSDIDIAKARQNKPKLYRKYSYRNHQYVYLKNLLWGNFWYNFPEIIWYNIKVLGYIFVREPFIIPDIGKVIKTMPLMLRKRKMIMARCKATSPEMQKWFE
ncbi:glycosyltransferase family 2 protein [Patescibacteria group bacterium]